MAARSADADRRAGARERRHIVGRAREWARLNGAAAASRDGDGSLLLVTGEAGIGKSALVEEFADVLRDAGDRVLVGHCSPFENIAFDGFVQAFEYLDATDAAAIDEVVLRGLSGVWRRADAVGSPAAGSPPVDAAAAELLRALSGQAPTVVIIEDLHWAPSSTRALLDSLARRLRRTSVLFLVTVRTPSMVASGGLADRTLMELSRIPGAQRVELAGLEDETRGCRDAGGDHAGDRGARR